MSDIDLEDVIQSSIEDSQTPEDPDLDTASDPSSLPKDAPEPVTTDTPDQDPSESSEVQSPAAQALKPPVEEDEFAKKFGIPSQSSSGRENRLPYSRVKKIVEKNERDTVTRITKEVEGKFTPQVQQYEAKVKDYEGRLSKVAEFEQVLANDPQRFLGMLATIPAYRQIFDSIQTQTPGTPAAPVTDDMPQPDQKLSDGSMVYSMDGLKSLLAWQAGQVQSKTAAEITSRYAPMEEQWKAHQQVQALVPKVQAEIDEARRWPLFNENETGIVQALQANRNLSLEGAYRQVVVLPSLNAAQKTQADTAAREKEIEASTRKKVLDELKRAPTSTSAPTSSNRPVSQRTGPRSLEDIIKDAIQPLK